MSSTKDDVEEYYSPSLAPPPELEMTQLLPSQQKQVHLVTWSKADDSKLPDATNPRQSFGNLVAECFNQFSKQVEYWACAREKHRCGGHHYHIAMKFTRKVRWSGVSKQLAKQNIHVHFQAFQSTYKDAFQYITKEDKLFVKSMGHPKMLPMIPKSMQSLKRLLDYELECNSQCSSSSSSQSAASSSSQTASSSSSESAQSDAIPQPPTKKRAPRLTNIQVATIIINNNVKSDLELCHLSKQLLQSNQPELANWLMNHPVEKNRLDLIKTVWKMHNSDEQVKRQNTPRLEKLRSYLQVEHASNPVTEIECNGRWLRAALQILESNEIPVQRWQELIQKCLKFGRNKKNNVFLVGERNCGKSFLLQPLEEIFTVFCNPAIGTFNWVGASEKEVIYLNDFRYEPVDKPNLIKWQDFLNLTDGNMWSVAVPKTHFAENVQWTGKQPILGSGPQQIKYIRAGMEDRTETAMMDSRWVYVHLTKSMNDDQIDNTLIPCPRCFAHLILNGSDMMFA
jgi:hypothetical protein